MKQCPLFTTNSVKFPLFPYTMCKLMDLAQMYCTPEQWKR